MSKRILVAYASKYGATEAIAERIVKTLEQSGLQVDCLAAHRAGDLAPYGAVVLGSAVYAGQWRKEAAAFFKANAEALAERPTWLFSSGPTGTGDPVALMHGWRLPKGLQPVADRVAPRDIAVFHGFADPARMNRLERIMIKAVKAPAGDFRDNAAIDAWAKRIAADLSSRE